jgi:hypothetical protein
MSLIPLLFPTSGGEVVYLMYGVIAFAFTRISNYDTNVIPRESPLAGQESGPLLHWK